MEKLYLYKDTVVYRNFLRMNGYYIFSSTADVWDSNRMEKLLRTQNAKAANFSMIKFDTEEDATIFRLKWS